MTIHLDEISPSRFICLTALYDFKPRVYVWADAAPEFKCEIDHESLTTDDERQFWWWAERWLNEPPLPHRCSSNRWLVTLAALKAGLVADPTWNAKGEPDRDG